MKPCNACGKCCVKYGDGQLSASKEDIDVWDGLRPDIARYTQAGDIWFDPVTKKQLSTCPWLRSVPGGSVFHCDIYYDRPEDCRIYPANVSDMVKDGCEMLEPGDLMDLKNAQFKLSEIHIADL